MGTIFYCEFTLLDNANASASALELLALREFVTIGTPEEILAHGFRHYTLAVEVRETPDMLRILADEGYNDLIRPPTARRLSGETAGGSTRARGYPLQLRRVTPLGIALDLMAGATADQVRDASVFIPFTNILSITAFQPRPAR